MTAPISLVIATRRSPLALWQAQWVASRLRMQYPACAVSLRTIVTEGDQRQETPLAAIGGKGVFVTALEAALVAGEADVAVHSLKDMPTTLDERFTLAAMCPRADVRDAVVSWQYPSLAMLPDEATVGTGSLRRIAQLLRLRRTLRPKAIRGNVGTRLAKMTAGDYDALLLASAGLRRLGAAHHIREVLSVDTLLPAIGQGVVAVQTLRANAAVAQMVATIDHVPTHLCVRAERACGATLGGTCHSALAAYATIRGQRLLLQARVLSPDGADLLSAADDGAYTDPEALGERVAKSLLRRGAAQLLQMTEP